MFNDYPDILTVRHLMRMLHIGKSTAYDLLKTNQIKHMRIGKKYIIPKKAVIGYVEKLCYNDDEMVNSRLRLVEEGATV